MWLYQSSMTKIWFSTGALLWKLSAALYFPTQCLSSSLKQGYHDYLLYFAFWGCDKHHDLKQPGEERVYSILQFIAQDKGTSAEEIKEGRYPDARTEAEALQESPSPWIINQENASQACVRSICWRCSLNKGPSHQVILAPIKLTESKQENLIITLMPHIIKKKSDKSTEWWGKCVK